MTREMQQNFPKALSRGARQRPEGLRSLPERAGHVAGSRSSSAEAGSDHGGCQPHVGGPGHSGQPATQPPTPTATETDEQIQRAGDMVEGRRPEQQQIQRAGNMVEGKRPAQKRKDTRKRQRVDTRKSYRQRS